MRAAEFITESDEKFVNYKTGNLNLTISSHVYDRGWKYRISNRMINSAISKLKGIEKELSTLEDGQASWALDPSTGLSLGVRKVSGNNKYIVGTARRHRTFDTGDRPVFKLHAGDVITKEQQLDELDFMGMSRCTKDCSGHEAGYAWSKARGGVHAASWSPSFNKGAEIAVAGY